MTGARLPQTGTPCVFASARNADATSWVARALVMATLVSSVAVGATDAHASFVIQNVDDAGEGLNDPVGVLPVGGNTGTTRGAQRLIALQYAADLMGQVISSPVDIVVETSFDELQCNVAGANLGSGGATTYFNDFTNQPHASTWYPAALADKLAGVDLGPGDSDMVLAFNSALGITCAFPSEYYYGLDANPASGQIDFVSVALNAFGKGLGFATLVDPETGVKGIGTGLDDVFMLFLEDHTTGKTFPYMTDAERAAASKKSGDLHWVGSAVVNNSASLSAGRDPSGHVLMYAPDPVEPGSSVSNWDKSLFPDQIMEPTYTGPNHDVGLLRYALEDIGWFLEPPPTTTTTVTGTSTTLPNSTTTSIQATTSTVAATTTSTPQASTTTTTTLIERICGDPSDDGAITASDALSTLRAGIGAESCLLCVCDVNASGGITAADALSVLRKAVGIDASLSCPAC